MKDRMRVCQFYECEGSCSKGREGTFYHYCQTCNLYNPLAGARPAKIDKRKKELDKIRKREDY